MTESVKNKKKSRYSLPEKIPLFIALAMVVLGILTYIGYGIVIGFFEDTSYNFLKSL